MNWHVACAIPSAMRWKNDHFPAERSIQGLGFETFVPRETRRVFRRGWRVDRVSPLLGSYLMVRFPLGAEWGRICDRRTGIVSLLVDFHGTPRTVPDAQIDRLRLFEQAMAAIRDKTALNLQPGERVIFSEGPMAARLARFKSASPRKRLKLVLEGGLEVEAPEHWVERAPTTDHGKGFTGHL